MGNKMYLIESPGGEPDILVTNGENWYCFSPGSNGYIGDVNFCEVKTIVYEDGLTEKRDLTLEELAEKVRVGIKEGKLYDADEFLYEYENADDCGNEGDNNRFLIKEWKGKTLEEIEMELNYVEDLTSGDVHPRGYDETSFLEI